MQKKSACFIHRFTLSNMKCPFFEVRHQKSVNYFCCQMKDAKKSASFICSLAVRYIFQGRNLKNIVLYCGDFQITTRQAMIIS